MKNNIRRIVFPLFVLLAVMSVSAYAHSGRTDSAGGHTNHSTGEYHYHHGYDDHQHYDMNGDGVADCPYKFKDNTIHKDSSSGSTAKSFTDEYNRLRQKRLEESEIKDNTSEEKQKKSSSLSFKDTIGIIFAVIFFGPLILYLPACIIAFICGEVRDLIQKTKRK